MASDGGTGLHSSRFVSSPPAFRLLLRIRQAFDHHGLKWLGCRGYSELGQFRSVAIRPSGAGPQNNQRTTRESSPLTRVSLLTWPEMRESWPLPREGRQAGSWGRAADACRRRCCP